MLVHQDKTLIPKILGKIAVCDGAFSDEENKRRKYRGSGISVVCSLYFTIHTGWTSRPEKRIYESSLPLPSGKADDAEAAGPAMAGNHAAGLHPDDLLKAVGGSAFLSHLPAGFLQTDGLEGTR